MKKNGKKKALFACFSMKFLAFLFLIIPKSAFSDEDTFEEFHGMIANYWNINR